jgi:hypothetical protein
MYSMPKSVERVVALLLCVAVIMTVGCMGSDTQPVVNDRPPGLGSDIGDQIASSGAAIGLAALLGGASVPLGETIGAEVAGILMAMIFSGGEDPDQEILSKLDQIQDTLKQIETELMTIENQLEAIEVRAFCDS